MCSTSFDVDHTHLKTYFEMHAYQVNHTDVKHAPNVEEYQGKTFKLLDIVEPPPASYR